METIEQKKRRLFGKQDLPVYLGELCKILKKDIDKSMILSIVETDNIREKNQAKKLSNSSKILFKNKEKLKSIIYEKEYPYYVFTSYSRDCGTLLINSLDEFNFEFSFSDITSGIITLTRKDLQKEIILDFYEEDKLQYIDIEIYLLDRSMLPCW